MCVYRIFIILSAVMPGEMVALALAYAVHIHLFERLYAYVRTARIY